MTASVPMYVVGRDPSTRRESSAEDKSNIGTIIAQLTAAVADTEADVQKTRAEANAEMAQLRRVMNDVEALLRAEREMTASLREQLAEAERLRLSAEADHQDALQAQRRLTDDAESRLGQMRDECDAARASIAQRDEIIGQLKAELASNRQTSDATTAQLRHEMGQLTAEASRWSSIVHAVEQVLAPRSEHTGGGESVAEARPQTAAAPADVPDPSARKTDGEASTSKTEPSTATAATPAATLRPIEAYAQQVLGTAEEMYEMDRQAALPTVEILERLVCHLRYARDLLVRRAADTAEGEAVFRRVLSSLFDQRWDHEFGRTLGFAMYELYGDSNGAEHVSTEG